MLMLTRFELKIKKVELNLFFGASSFAFLIFKI